MNDSKSAAAHHPQEGPSDAVLEQAAKAGIKRGDSFSYENVEYDGRQQTGQGEQGETTFVEMQAEAEAGETHHDVEAAAADKRILDQLRELYSFDSYAADCRRILSLPQEAQDVAFHGSAMDRVNVTRLLLGIPVPTQQELIELTMSIIKEQDEAKAAESGS